MTLRGFEPVLLGAANLVAVAAFAWPLVVPAAAGPDGAHAGDAPWITLVLSLCLGGLLLAQLGRPGLGPKRIAIMGVLAAAMVVLRLPGFVAGFSAMFIVVLVAGNAFGAGFGFTLGATGTLASSLFLGGIGPWLPFQMAAVGWVGAGAGLLPRSGPWSRRIGILAVYGAATGYLFGMIMNLWFWPFMTSGTALGWEPALGAGENLGRYGRFYLLTSAAWDSFRAAGNAALVVVLGRPLLGALDRAARRMRVDIGGDPRRHNRYRSRPDGRGRSTAEESPDSIGQDAGENPRRGDPRKVQQRADRRQNQAGKGERVR